jgi:hypothetical protein
MSRLLGMQRIRLSGFWRFYVIYTAIAIAICVGVFLYFELKDNVRVVPGG